MDLIEGDRASSFTIIAVHCQKSTLQAETQGTDHPPSTILLRISFLIMGDGDTAEEALQSSEQYRLSRLRPSLATINATLLQDMHWAGSLPEIFVDQRYICMVHCLFYWEICLSEC